VPRNAAVPAAVWTRLGGLVLTSDEPGLEEAARRAEKAGDYEAAFQAWRKLASETKNSVFYCQMGRVARELGRWVDAEKAFLGALRVDSRLTVAMVALGSLYLSRTDGDRTGNAKMAKAWLLQASGIDRTAPALSLLGTAHYALGVKDAAKEAYRAAIEVDGSYEEAYFNLGVLEQKDGNDADAERLFRRAIQLDPGRAGAHARLGVLLHNRGRHLEAESEFRRCIELDPYDYFSHLYLANTLGVQHREAEAEQEFRTAIAIRPGEEPAIQLFAHYLESLFRIEEAAQLRSQLSRKPN
jgi:tetratricopeptide (TPR) repeat protein